MRIHNTVVFLIYLLIIFSSVYGFYDEDDDSIFEDFVVGGVIGLSTEACEQNNICKNIMIFNGFMILLTGIIIQIIWCCNGIWCDKLEECIDGLRYDRLAVGGAGYVVGRTIY